MIAATSKTGIQITFTPEELEAERQSAITAEATRRIEEDIASPLVQHKEFSKVHKVLLDMVLTLDPDIISKLMPENQAILANALAIDAEITAVRTKENEAITNGTALDAVPW